MNSCEQTQTELANALADGNLQMPAKLQVHLRGCANCRQAWQEMKLTWRALGGLSEEEVPARLLETTRTRVLDELEREQANLESARMGKSTLVSVTMGLVFSVASVWVLGQKSDLTVFSPQVLLSMGAAWAALYAAAVLLAMRGGGVPRYGIAARWVGIAGLLAMGLSLALTRSCSIGQALDYCQMSPGVRHLFAGVQSQTLYFLLGSLYSLAPLLIATAIVGIKAPRHPVVLGLMAAGVFVLLTLPAIVLQCGAFSVGISLSWIFGSVVGSLAGGSVGSLAGAVLYRHLLQVGVSREA
ncbi:MAG TPA: hypothetical protein VKV28_15015 [Candidatus Binataceae bacterium]|nr:hypothetical protein [Candidatus Binataceae bacterium]